MKKVLLFIATLLTVAFVYSQAPDTWTQRADFGGTGRSVAVGFSIGSKGYLGMGGRLKDFWEYDPVINTWTQKANFGGITRHGAVGFSIGSKGYIGTGVSRTDTKDFWEYNPAANTWTQKADFGGTERKSAVGFSIGNKGYIGIGWSTNHGVVSYYKDFWEYDPATDTWTRKADFVGKRYSAVGFSIGSKGYIGTGVDDVFKKDFWEYDPVTNSWTQKADFGGTAREGAVGFSIGSKGYIGTGTFGIISSRKDFWEYDPVTNTWAQKADFGGTERYYAVGFSIGSKGYLGTGVYYDETNHYYKDFWEYTPSDCPAPYNLRMPKITDTCARLNWNVPGASVEHIKISYRPLGNSVWIEDRKKSLENSKVICGLKPNTTYEWRVRNICTDEKTGWVNGPDFTTTASPEFTSIADDVNSGKVQGNVGVQIMPNPNKGSFTLQIQLTAKSALTTLALYDNLGAIVWKQDAGRLSGSINRNIALESKLAAGVYVLMVQHGSTRLMQKVVVVK